MKKGNKPEKEQKPKVNLKDIIEGKAMREVNTFEVNGVRYWADRITKDQIATHADCQRCNNEFEKPYTYSRYCFNCEGIINNEKFKQLELVEWNGKDGLCLWGDDTYFFSLDDIEIYCEENGVDIHSLQLVLCRETSFGSINIYECLADDLHEDWEPDAKLEGIQKDLDEYLSKASTNTWTATNKRVQL